MDIIPGRLAPLSFEGFFRLIAGIDEGAVELLDDDAVGLKNRALILAGKFGEIGRASCRERV